MSIEICAYTVFSKNFDEIDFAKTAQDALKFALPAIALAGAVALVDITWGVVVILTGLVVTAAYVIFCATLLEELDIFSNVSEASEKIEDEGFDTDSITSSSSEEVSAPLPPEDFHIDLNEIEMIIGPVQNLPVLDVETHPYYKNSEFLDFLEPNDLLEPLMQGTSEGCLFIAIKLHIKAYYFTLDVDADQTKDASETISFKYDPEQPIIDKDVVEVLYQTEPNSQEWIVASSAYPQGLSSEWAQPNWCMVSYPTRETVLNNLTTLMSDKQPVIAQVGGILYFYHFSSDSSLRVE